MLLLIIASAFWDKKGNICWEKIGIAKKAWQPLTPAAERT